MRDNYWIDYWLSGKLNKNENLHAKVGRTIAGIPVEEEAWMNTLNFILSNVGDLKEMEIADICAGSGAITLPLSNICKSVTAIDISEDLLLSFPEKKNIFKITADARDFIFKPESIDVAICHFSLQHFSEGEALELMQRVFNGLRPGGKFYIGDIPEVSKRFNFFNNDQRRKAFFDSIHNNRPTMGTWFDPNTLKYMGDYVGYSNSEIIRQPSNLIFSHYRFDILLEK
jgi:ubiquinone/menaquinone biosynthesis C-methylase UbiE